MRPVYCSCGRQLDYLASIGAEHIKNNKKEQVQYITGKCSCGSYARIIMGQDDIISASFFKL